MMYNYGYPSYGHMLGWGIGGLLISVLVWVIIVCVIVAVIRRIIWGSRHGHRRWRHWEGMNGASGLDVLNERYAKGEINKEEYEQKKKDILN